MNFGSSASKTHKLRVIGSPVYVCLFVDIIEQQVWWYALNGKIAQTTHGEKNQIRKASVASFRIQLYNYKITIKLVGLLVSKWFSRLGHMHFQTLKILIHIITEG